MEGKDFAQWTGQTSYSILQRYIKVDDEYKRDEMVRAFG